MERIVSIFYILIVFLEKYKNFIGHFLHGLKLKSYEFKKYKTKKDTRVISINVLEIKINHLYNNN